MHPESPTPSLCLSSISPTLPEWVLAVWHIPYPTRLVQIKIFVLSHAPFSPSSISISDNSWPRANILCNCLLNGITYVLIIKLKWSDNQCRFCNYSGKIALFCYYHRLVVDVTSYVDLSSSAYINVSDSNKMYDFLLSIQVLIFPQFTRSFTCVIASHISSAKKLTRAH